MKLDNSTHQDFAFGLEQYRYIDSVVQPVIKLAKVDSIENFEKHLYWINEVERNELNGIPLVKHCLNFYISEELDEIAGRKVTEMNFLWKER